MAETDDPAERHDTSWSINLEQQRHEADRDCLLTEAKRAVRQTEAGYHVNLVTHAAHGHPSGYLYDVLSEAFEDVTYEYIDQCGCGGHVTRVHVE